ncbi:hypothetical protein [Vibrio alginolyticus]|uniref:hypothetical protein n=1 Tax=Vibrio alginolyticus TaxID=663 RepID=UPI00071FEFBF|nr:hypothetical protein [Vibrio alginolyticus]ALR91287.1 hypothetical protein AT730_02370 [Vibrio alginolyticus]MBY7707958.1 hypothetical protein [Vibrio alginolyticus]
MKRGKIDTDSIPISDVVTITAPVQIVIRNGEYSVMELVVAGKKVPHFRGFANVLLERQREFEKGQKQKTPTGW